MSTTVKRVGFAILPAPRGYIIAPESKAGQSFIPALQVMFNQVERLPCDAYTIAYGGKLALLLKCRERVEPRLIAEALRRCFGRMLR